PARPKRSILQKLRPVLRLIKLTVRVLLWDPLRRRSREWRAEDGTPWEQFCRGLLYRLTFLPIFVALAVAAMVYAGTHPRQQTNELDPSSQGIYYDPVTLRSEDGVRLEAWIVPVFEASQILRDKETVLRAKQPAVLLLHDYAQNRQQMLPLIRPLHDAGFVVMSLAFRGCGPSAPAGSTFGLLESNDVRTAVSALRRCNFVDAKRLAIVGVGLGANAGLIVAANDPSIKTMVLDHPGQSGNQILDDLIGPRQGSLYWMQPMCKWAFELVYQVHTDDLNMSKYGGLM
ncbi:MAG TPA: hypothetical protein VHS31_06300, partial [Tepidisphaeraceae bacterium]|nr:hypothetical protein [Tepidisphaeraceae bacterium]